MIALLATLAGAADPSPILDRAEYRFCNEPGVDGPQALAWCDSLEGLPEDVCPGLRATCAGATGPESGCQAGTTSSPGRAGGAPEPPARPPELPDFPDLGCPDVDTGFLESLAKWTMALGVALLVLFVLRLLSRWMGRPRPEFVAAGVAAEAPPPPHADEVPDRPSGDLLRAARDALALGRTGEAVMLARGAALRRLAERGRIALHRSRTDREHVRAMRDDPEVFEDLRQVSRAAETVRWGGLGVDRRVAEQVLDAAGRLVAVLAALAVFGEARAADRYGPRGDAGLAAVLERAGHPVAWRTEPLETLDAATQLLVLDLNWVTPSPEDGAALRAWVEAGGVLVVAGDAADTFPELGELETATAPPQLAGWLADTGLLAPRWPESPVDAWSGGEALAGEPGAAAIAELAIGAGVVVAVADGRLLENGSLVRPENRVFLGELLQLGQSLGGWPVASPIPVELATRAFGISQDAGAGCQPAQGLANGRLIALILQVLFVWGLVAAMRATSLAVPRDPPAEDRLLFSDHAEALARRAWRSGDRAWADAAAARLWLHRLGPAGLESAAQRAGSSPAEAKQMAERVERLAAGGTSDPELVEALWRMTR